MPASRTVEPSVLAEAPAGQDRALHAELGADPITSDLAHRLITFLETGTAPAGLFTADVFCDFTIPTWRLQFQGLRDVVAGRIAGHPGPGRVPRSRLDQTTTGFVLEVEEEWEHDGDSWYCRELIRADVSDGSISEISVYCTGDWSSAQVATHASAVRLLRP